MDRERKYLSEALMDQMLVAMGEEGEFEDPFAYERAKQRVAAMLILFENRSELLEPTEKEVEQAERYAEAISAQVLWEQLEEKDV